MWTKWDPIEWYFYCTLIVLLSWPEDGRSRPQHVAKYHLIVIIASCLMYVVYWRCLMYYTDLIIRNGMAISQIYASLHFTELYPTTLHYTYRHFTSSHLHFTVLSYGDRGSTVVKVLCCKSKGRWFDPSWCQWIFHSHKILPIALWPCGRLSL